MISKNKNLFLKIYILFLIITIITLIVLQILGFKNRVGYLIDFELRNLYQIDNPDNTITTNYIYGFRIRYYDKVFRNSDIYGVYLNTNNLPNYIKEIKFREKGSPYGDLISSKLIAEEKIDNINYNLKLKNIFVLYCIILLIVILFFISNTSNIIYAILFIINILLYYLIHFILSKFSILTLRFNFFDIILSFIFIIIAFNLLNKKILLTLLFEAINIFSFFVIEPIL